MTCSERWSRGRATAPAGGVRFWQTGAHARSLQSIGQHRRFMLGHLLHHIELVERQIEQLSAEIEAWKRPYDAHAEPRRSRVHRSA